MHQIVRFLFIIFMMGMSVEASQKYKVLVGSPVRQKPAIFKQFLDSLDRLDQEQYELHYYFIDDNVDPETKQLLKNFKGIHGDKVLIEAVDKTLDFYLCDEIGHHWNDEILWKVAAFKDRMIEHAYQDEYDFLFLIDSDLVLHPKTVTQLIEDDKEVISNIFWTRWGPGQPELPQVWLSDVYNLYAVNPGEKLSAADREVRQQEFLSQLRVPGVYEVGGLGACTLISRSALEKGVKFKRLKNLTFWGEDRHFCIRAASMGIELYVDTHFPAYHIFRESSLEGVEEYITSTLVDKKKPRLTLSMIVKNEADRYLEQVLLSAREYITDAVIIDDGSSDHTVQMCREILADIPLKLVENKESKFANEVTLRRQQWEETIATHPDWILALDADEIFEERFKDEVPHLLTRNDVDGFLFRLYDMWDNEHYREDQYWFAHKTYRNFLIRYKPELNYVWKETKQHCGRFPLTVNFFKMDTSPLRLKHFGWAKESDRIAKYERYQRLDPEAKYGWKEQYESILDPQPHLVKWEEHLEETNRFFLKTDPTVTEMAGIYLRSTWWSRPYEYAWAASFAGPDHVVLDAACGISHPFKWWLGKTCKETWACDTDSRIESIGRILQEIYDDLGRTSFLNARNNLQLLESIKLVKASISQLPSYFPNFDRIFCISTLEHMTESEQAATLKEFAKFLNPEGLIVLTVDYPVITPEKLFKMAEEAGLEPVGDVQWSRPSLLALHSTELSLHVYRCVLKHQSEF